jgi:hypothetical protein
MQKKRYYVWEIIEWWRDIVDIVKRWEWLHTTLQIWWWNKYNFMWAYSNLSPTVYIPLFFLAVVFIFGIQQVTILLHPSQIQIVSEREARFGMMLSQNDWYFLSWSCYLSLLLLPTWKLTSILHLLPRHRS